MPTAFGGTRGSRDKESKDPNVQGSRNELLREEAGHRAVALEGAARPVRAGLEPTDAEAGVRRAAGADSGIGIEVVAGEVSVELLPADEPLGMRERHAEAEEPAEAELVRSKDLTGAADGASPMPQSELGRDDQDVAGLLLGNLPDRFERPRLHALPFRRDLTPAVVLELPRVADLLEGEVGQSAVLRSQPLDSREESLARNVGRRNSEPAFGAVGQLGQVLRVRERPRRIQTGELRDQSDLLLDRLRTRVLGRVGPVRSDLLIGCELQNSLKSVCSLQTKDTRQRRGF